MTAEPRVRVGAERSSIDDKLRHLRNRLLRIVCSDSWRRHCEELFTEGHLTLKTNVEKELRRTRHYPPGGAQTLMRQCVCCGHWTPPAREAREVTKTPRADGGLDVWEGPWQAVCLDCFHANMPLPEMVHVPSSPGFSRPVKPAQIAGGGMRVQRRRRNPRRDA